MKRSPIKRCKGLDGWEQCLTCGNKKPDVYSCAHCRGLGAVQTKRKRNKFNAVSQGGKASKLEAAVGRSLELRQMAGEISELTAQATVCLLPASSDDGAVNWAIDYRFVEDGRRVYVEAKGVSLTDYVIKRKLFAHHGDGELRIVQGSAQNFKVVKTIVPDRVRENPEVALVKS